MFFQQKVTPVDLSTDLSSQTALISGANTGLGYGCSLQLLRLRLSTLILAVRSPSKGEAAREKLLADPIVNEINANAKIVVYELDLASYDSTLAFAGAITNDFTHLDIVVLNGAVNFFKYTTSPSTSNETCLQVNYLSNALLSILLLPLLLASASPGPSHLTLVSSKIQKSTSLSKKHLPSATSIFTFFNSPANFNISRYNDTKLFVSMFARSLSAHVDPKKVVVNTVCPGLVKTGFDSTLPWYVQGVMWVVRGLVARELEEGASTLTFAGALADEESHGELLVDNKPADFLQSTLVPDGENLEKRLWEETLLEIQRVSPGAGSFITSS